MRANDRPLGSNQVSNHSHKPAPVIVKPTGIEPDEEEKRRLARYKLEYRALIEDINRREQLREYMETRRRIWKQSTEKAQARIEEIEAEKKQLQNQIAVMKAAWVEFEQEYDVLGPTEEDLAKWEMFHSYFNLDTDELRMGRGAG